MVAKDKEIINMELQDYPSPQYKKFFEKFAEIDTLPVSDWNATHLIAYFCAKYKQHYNIEYTFKFNSPFPSKSYEIYNINKLSHMISKNPSTIKDYIDWFFEKKIILKKKRITSMAFLTNQSVVNDFKWFILKPAHIDRTTPLPSNILHVVSKFSQYIKTYGDLAFVMKNAEYAALCGPLTDAGFDINLLNKVK